MKIVVSETIYYFCLSYKLTFSKGKCGRKKKPSEAHPKPLT